MALHFTIKMNGEPIGYFYAQRRERRVPVDGQCSYDVALTLNRVERRFVVNHDYHDGAFALIRRALGSEVG
jgi:hypothetical protein